MEYKKIKVGSKYFDRSCCVYARKSMYYGCYILTKDQYRRAKKKCGIIDADYMVIYDTFENVDVRDFDILVED